MHILFATYRTYTDSGTLINTILARYRAVVPASLEMTEGVRQKTLKYACTLLSYSFVLKRNSFRSLSMALTCLLTAYKEDFYEPPNYTLLHHLLRHVPRGDDALEHQCQSLLNRFLRDGKNVLQTDSGSSPLAGSTVIPARFAVFRRYVLVIARRRQQ